MPGAPPGSGPCVEVSVTLPCSAASSGREAGSGERMTLSARSHRSSALKGRTDCQATISPDTYWARRICSRKWRTCDAGSASPRCAQSLRSGSGHRSSTVPRPSVGLTCSRRRCSRYCPGASHRSSVALCSRIGPIRSKRRRMLFRPVPVPPGQGRAAEGRTTGLPVPVASTW